MYNDTFDSKHQINIHFTLCVFTITKSGTYHKILGTLLYLCYFSLLKNIVESWTNWIVLKCNVSQTRTLQIVVQPKDHKKNVENNNFIIYISLSLLSHYVCASREWTIYSIWACEHSSCPFYHTRAMTCFTLFNTLILLLLVHVLLRSAAVHFMWQNVLGGFPLAWLTSNLFAVFISLSIRSLHALLQRAYYGLWHVSHTTLSYSG